MSRAVVAAIVGLGWWGRRLVGAVQGRSRRIRFVHGVTKEPADAEAFAAEHGLAISSELDSVLADPAIEAVVLATPHSLHGSQIRAVAASGRHVFCEKPLALTESDARSSVAACARARVTLGLGHNRRFYPAMVELFRRVGVGELGELLHVEGHFSHANAGTTRFAPWRHEPAEAPAGGLTGSGLHVLDTFTGLAGRAAQVHAQLLTRRSGPDPTDTIAVTLRFASGASGQFAVVRSTSRYWRIHAFGERGSAEVLGADAPVLLLHDRDGGIRRLEFPEVDTLRSELEAFADSVRGEAPYPIDPEQMLDTVAAFEAIVASVSQGRAVEIGL